MEYERKPHSGIGQCMQPYSGPVTRSARRRSMTRRLSFVALLLLMLASVSLLHRPVTGETVLYRLANGTVAREGRVERYSKVKEQNETVCDASWDLNAADVFCRSQGLGFAVQAQIGRRFGPGSGGVWGAPKCTGQENSLDDCALNKTGCSHELDAGVICSGALKSQPCLYVHALVYVCLWGGGVQINLRLVDL